MPEFWASEITTGMALFGSDLLVGAIEVVPCIWQRMIDLGSLVDSLVPGTWFSHCGKTHTWEEAWHSTWGQRGKHQGETSRQRQRMKLRVGKNVGGTVSKPSRFRTRKFGAFPWTLGLGWPWLSAVWTLGWLGKEAATSESGGPERRGLLIKSMLVGSLSRN